MMSGNALDPIEDPVATGIASSKASIDVENKKKTKMY